MVLGHVIVVVVVVVRAGVGLLVLLFGSWCCWSHLQLAFGYRHGVVMEENEGDEKGGGAHAAWVVAV